MSPRRRNEKRRGFPPNLYETGGYYSWRNPMTGKHYGIGRDRSNAFREAVTANMRIGATKLSLVERITAKPVNTWGDWVDKYREILAKRKLAAKTRVQYKSLLKRALGTFEATENAAEISTQMIADAIDALAQTHPRQAQAFRSFLRDCFRVMVAKGWRKDNPVDVTDFVTVDVMRSRLSFEVFMTIYRATEDVTLRNAMALSLVSGQARESCCDAQFKDFHDGYWWSVRGKTNAHIQIPVAIRLDAFGMSLDDVLKQCRATGVLSKRLLHRITPAPGAVIGGPVHIDVLTRKFTQAVAALGLEWGDKEPPSFHEIRSLASRMHKEQGSVDPQELLGHKDPRTTATYTDGRGEWVRVGLKP